MDSPIANVLCAQASTQRSAGPAIETAAEGRRIKAAQAAAIIVGYAAAACGRAVGACGESCHGCTAAVCSIAASSCSFLTLFE